MLKKADNVETGRVNSKPDLRMIGKKEIYVGLQESWFKRDFKKNNQMLPLLPVSYTHLTLPTKLEV